MWNRVYPEANSLQLLRTALENSNLNAYTDFYVMTGNYRFELRGQFFGAYFIGGGGLYVRYAHLSQSVTVAGFGTPCTQTWLWWGFNCAGGIVSASQTLASRTSSALGGNAGGGMTFRVSGAPYRIYAEARYCSNPATGPRCLLRTQHAACRATNSTSSSTAAARVGMTRSNLHFPLLSQTATEMVSRCTSRPTYLLPLSMRVLLVVESCGLIHRQLTPQGRPFIMRRVIW